MADFKFCMCNMFLVTDSSDDTTISYIKSQVREYREKNPQGELVDVLGEKLTPTKQSRKRKKPAENKTKSKSKPKTSQTKTVTKSLTQDVDTPSQTLPEDDNPQVDDPTEEERKYMALATIYKNDTNCKAPPFESLDKRTDERHGLV